MVKLYPVNGIRYNPEINMKEVIAPPYDVIKPQEQAQLYERSPYNFIHLEYGYKLPQDNEKENRYTRAAQALKRWLDEGVLVEDTEPCFYLYVQDFIFKKSKFTRTGLIAAAALTPYSEGIIVPHEKTMSKPKEDRLNLLRHCQANLSPIFSLFDDKDFHFSKLLTSFKVTGQKPSVDFFDEAGSHHRLWQIKDFLLAEKIQDFFRDKQLFIADGHHRYETALAYWKEEEARGRKGFDRVMMFLFNLADAGIMVLPTHRVIKTKVNFTEKLTTKLEENFLVEEFPLGLQGNNYLDSFLHKLQEAGKKSSSFGLYPGGSSFYLCTYKYQLDELDVNLLQKHVLEKYLGINALQLKEKDVVSYHKNAAEALKLAREETGRMAVFLNPPSITKVIERAKKGLIMPQKSTYFHPKISSGLIINKLPG